jgi:hypothetical protein
MTKAQELKIDYYRKLYQANCDKYSHLDTGSHCQFSTKKPASTIDPTLTIKWVKITGISDHGEVSTVENWLNILEDGHEINMSTDFEPGRLEAYIKSLIDYE